MTIPLGLVEMNQGDQLRILSPKHIARIPIGMTIAQTHDEAELERVATVEQFLVQREDER